MDFPEMGCLDGSWTNEKHISFLNWMEATFVKRMQGNVEHPPQPDDQHLRLDRYMPDSAESTLDFETRRNGKRTQKIREKVVSKRGRDAGEETKMRGRSSRRNNATQDQVVPELGSMQCKRTERDE